MEVRPIALSKLEVRPAYESKEFCKRHALCFQLISGTIPHLWEFEIASKTISRNLPSLVLLNNGGSSKTGRLRPSASSGTSSCAVAGLSDL